MLRGLAKPYQHHAKKKTVLCVQVNESSLIHQQVVPLVDHLVGPLVGLPVALVEHLEAWGLDHLVGRLVGRLVDLLEACLLYTSPSPRD